MYSLTYSFTYSCTHLHTYSHTKITISISANCFETLTLGGACLFSSNSQNSFKPTIISVVLFSFQIFFSFSVKIRYIFAVLADAEYFVFFVGFVNGLVVRDGAFVGKDIAAVGGEEDIGLLQPVGHTHQYLILGHQFGIVDKHCH